MILGQLSKTRAALRTRMNNFSSAEPNIQRHIDPSDESSEHEAEVLAVARITGLSVAGIKAADLQQIGTER